MEDRGYVIHVQGKICQRFLLALSCLLFFFFFFVLVGSVVFLLFCFSLFFFFFFLICFILVFGLVELVFWCQTSTADELKHCRCRHFRVQ